MASTPTFQSNPYGSFDPSQWSNPYSNYAGSALPWPSSYAGMPTNALGQPIGTPQGMTLNQTPAQPQAPAARAPAGPAFFGGTGLGMNGANPQIPATPSFGGSQYAGSQYAPQAMPYMPNPAYQQQAAAPQAAPAPGGNNWQQTLAMLANPGQVTTPGATVPQASASAQPGPGVLQSFLQNWQPKQSGPGSGFTQNFNTILRGLQAQKAS